MITLRADLHIHTVLSPCASLDMSPANIVASAREKGLNLIGITDHNSTLNCGVVKKIAETAGIHVLCGAEVTTREEVHCLSFFELPEQLNAFQQIIDNSIMKIPNNPEKFGYQPVVDEHDNITEMIDWYLPVSLKLGITEIQNITHSLNGIFIPAHINRPQNGILNQLGFIPDDLNCDALEISLNIPLKKSIEKYVIQHKSAQIAGSDAHFLSQIGEFCTMIIAAGTHFNDIKYSLSQPDRCIIQK